MPDAPTIRDLLIFVIGAGGGALINHYLGRDSARSDRIRAARVKLRRFIDEVDGTGGIYVVKVHERIYPEIVALKHSLMDDLRIWSRGRFLRACDIYLSTTRDECRPVVRPRMIGSKQTEEEAARDKAEFIRPKLLIKSRLEAVLRRI